MKSIWVDCRHDEIAGDKGALVLFQFPFHMTRNNSIHPRSVWVVGPSGDAVILKSKYELVMKLNLKAELWPFLPSIWHLAGKAAQNFVALPRVKTVKAEDIHICGRMTYPRNLWHTSRHPTLLQSGRQDLATCCNCAGASGYSTQGVPLLRGETWRRSSGYGPPRRCGASGPREPETQGRIVGSLSLTESLGNCWLRSEIPSQPTCGVWGH